MDTLKALASTDIGFGRADLVARTESGRLNCERSRCCSYFSFSMSTSYLPPSHPDQPEEIIEALPSTFPDEEIDNPQPELVIQVYSRKSTKLDANDQSRPSADGQLALSPVVLGCATFGYGIYQNKSDIVSTLPVRIVRLALRAGITAFDTCKCRKI